MTKYPCPCTKWQTDLPNLIDGKLDLSAYKLGPCTICNDTKELDYEFPECVEVMIDLRGDLTSEEREKAMNESIISFRKKHPRAYCTIWGETYAPLDPTAPTFPTTLDMPRWTCSICGKQICGNIPEKHKCEHCS